MADKTKKSVRDVLHDMREEGIRFLDLKFVDVYGTLQHITVPAEVVDENALNFGFSFDGSSVRGFKAINEADMILRPDPSSVFKDPFFDDPAFSLFGDVIDPIRYEPYRRDPRGVAQRAERLVRSLGIADNALFRTRDRILRFRRSPLRSINAAWLLLRQLRERVLEHGSRRPEGE